VDPDKYHPSIHDVITLAMLQDFTLVPVHDDAQSVDEDVA